jgi:hypothetical protein
MKSSDGDGIVAAIIVGGVVGFASSRILFAPTHAAGFPELGRYGIGQFLIALVMKLTGFPNEVIVRFLIVSEAVGIGVAASRIAGDKC